MFDPGASTPAALADKMRREPLSEGEHRIVTVLFADAVGSTQLAEQLGEEGMYAFMRECLSRMSEAVHRYEGYVASFTGDGIMALFGAPIAHEDSARRAVASALGMQRSLAQFTAEMEQSRGIGAQFRVGLNTGPVVVGTVTDSLRLDFTAIGDTVNLAARMQEAAEPGCTFVSEATHHVVAGFFACEGPAEVPVKGKDHAVRAWRVFRERPERTRFEAAAERGLSRFVGRADELDVLEQCAGRARNGAGGVVVVSGEAGIGKSRLLFELRRRLRPEEMAWVEGHCVSYGRNIPYLPFIDLLKHAFGVEEEDTDAEVGDRVDRAVGGWEEPAHRCAPYLKHILAVDPGDEVVVRMDPRERRVGVLEALRALMVQESSARPHVIVLEDLHWADEMSMEALATLADVVPSAPVLLVLTCRSGSAGGLGSRPDVTRLGLGQLDDGESLALAEDLLDGATLPGELSQLIAAKAEGNPFYVEEVTKGLVEAGVLVRNNGTYTLRGAMADIHIPDNIQEVVLARIDRLQHEAKRAIQLASVIGREFTARLLDRISNLRAGLPEVLGELEALELIYEKALFPELAYMFKHALTHDVAYGTLLTERRRALHRIVAASVEELYHDRLAEHFEILAHHYVEGQDWDKALQYLAKAGGKAADAYANREALAFFAKALEVCDVLGDQALPAYASLAAKRGFINFQIGEVPAAIADFDRMVDAARRLGNRSLEGTALAFRGFLELYNHEEERAEPTLQAAWSVVEEGFEEVRPLASLGLAQLYAFYNAWPKAEPFLAWAETAPVMPDPMTEGLWCWSRGLFAYWRGHCRSALRVLGDISDAAEAALVNRLPNWWIRAMALGGCGEYEAAAALLRRTLDTCERVGDWAVRPRAVNTLGWVFAETEDREQALYWNRLGVDLGGKIRGLPDPEIEMNARLNLADDLAATGALAEAAEQFSVVEAVVRNPTPPQRWLLWRYSLHFFASFGDLCLERGDAAGALSFADECLGLAEQTSSAKYVVRARRLRGRALTVLGRPDEAEHELTAALEIAVPLENPPQLWKTHVAVGDLRRVQRRSAEARRAFDEALSVIDAMAERLTTRTLRERLLCSEAVEQVRALAGRPR